MVKSLRDLGIIKNKYIFDIHDTHINIYVFASGSWDRVPKILEFPEPGMER